MRPSRKGERRDEVLLLYNMEKLQKIVWEIHNLTGFTIGIFDADLTQIFRYTNSRNRYCSMIQSTDVGRQRCLRSDEQLLRMCMESRKAVTHYCHAGFADTAVPIFNGNAAIGFIVFGQVAENGADKPSYEVLRDKVCDLQLDIAQLKEAYDSLLFFDRDKINSAAEILTLLAKQIWLEHMIQPAYNDDFERVLEYIDSHLEEKLTVTSLCHQFNVSKNALYSNFRTHFNCTVNQYINRIRITKAEQLLKTTNLSVLRVCELSGVDNYYYFCRLFKSQKGVTPLQYRKKWHRTQESCSPQKP